MPPVRSLKVFGSAVEITVDGAMSHGVTSVVVSTVPPGGGLPPHAHEFEDEMFMALEGDFELQQDGEWTPLPIDEPVFSPRGTTHSYRNTGKTAGRLATIYAPAGFEQWFEEVNGLSPASEMKQILNISEEYGVTIHTGRAAKDTLK
jgi:mannose-6-phosphate isomerase-like protein (cupin superfamily)